jgi:hypothetical protein
MGFGEEIATASSTKRKKVGKLTKHPKGEDR